MRKIFKQMYFAVISFALTLLTVVAGIFPATISVLAQETNEITYEHTNVMDDLKDSTVNGKEFSLLEYGFNAFKETQVLSFVEYCYSFYQNLQDNYGLYVYVYNPKGLRFVTESGLNQIQFAYGTSTSQNYEKYRLAFLNCSTETNYEGLFYKFKVMMTETQKQALMEGLNSTERIYRISGIELLEYGQTNATELTVGTTYHYSGYAQGYGGNPTAENTLTCSSEQAEVLSLNVYPTVYRPNGSNGKSEWHQDSLHSVYFAVPNQVIRKYGVMSAVHATWLNAVIAPMLVTGNYDAYSAISAYVGKQIPQAKNGYHTDDLYFMYYGACTGAGAWYSNATSHYGYSYNAMTGWSGHSMLNTYYGKAVNPLYGMFYAGSGKDSADNYVLSSAQIQTKLRLSKEKYGGELVNGKYSRVMFESVDSEFTDVNIRADETYSLTEQKIDKAWWNGLFGIDRPDKVTTTVFDDIQAIYAVKESDLEGSAEEVAKRLYISKGDYEEFSEYYNANKDLCTVYLFRYQTSDYISQEATLYQYYPDGSIFTTGRGWQKCDTNAYFFQQTVNLDFDIIDVTFSNGSVDTVIPIVSTPIDVIPDATPPLHTQSDKPPAWWTWLKLAIGLFLLGVLIAGLMPIVKLIFRIIKKIFTWEDEDKTG